MMILDAKPLNFSEDSGESKRLTYEHFHRIMCAPSNDAYDPKAKMKRLDKFREPLSHYYIASSHNTYLASDHLTGAASIDRYIDVLDKGCRCVEIQCADGGADSIPIVTHGISFAKSIAFDGTP